MSEPVVLGIESTCDETAAAIVRGRELLSNVVASSMEEHARYGGVIPEIASRAHAEAFVPCVSKALADANMTLADVDAIAVSAGPGLAGCLAVGVSGAKALAWAANKPIYGINHVIGHIAVTQLQFGPFPKDTLALIVSGGHTSLLHVEDMPRKIDVVGTTLDDARGVLRQGRPPARLPVSGRPAHRPPWSERRPARHQGADGSDPRQGRCRAPV